MQQEIIFPKKEVPFEVPSGICVQYAEGFDEINEKTVRKIIKNVRKGPFQHLYLALDPDGESSFFQMVRQNGYAALAIGIETCVDNCVKWTSYLSYNSRYAASDEVSPIRYDQDIFLKKYTIQDSDAVSKCVEWFIRTGTPYPGIDWAKPF